MAFFTANMIVVANNAGTNHNETWSDRGKSQQILGLLAYSSPTAIKKIDIKIMAWFSSTSRYTIENWDVITHRYISFH